MSNVLLRYFDSGNNALFQKPTFGPRSDFEKKNLKKWFLLKIWISDMKKYRISKVYFLDKKWNFNIV